MFAVDRADGCGGPFTPVATVTGPVTFAPEAPTSNLHADMLQMCEPDGARRRVRGDVQVVDEAGSPRTVNRLGMEAYLRGVVPQESPASWGPLGGSRHERAAGPGGGRPFVRRIRGPLALRQDVRHDELPDVRRGHRAGAGGGVSSVEQATTDLAVAQTAGQVRRFGNGIVARTEFSSSTGGWTAGGTFPVVPDEGDTRSPHHTWTVAVPAATVEAAYPGIGSFRALDVTQRNGVGDWGGRVVSAVVRGSAGAVPRPATTCATGSACGRRGSRWPRPPGLRSRGATHGSCAARSTAARPT